MKMLRRCPVLVVTNADVTFREICHLLMYCAKCIGRVQLKCDGIRRRRAGEVKGKLANEVVSQYSSHYLGTWCIQHYYR